MRWLVLALACACGRFGFDSIVGFGIEFSPTTQMFDEPRIDVWIDDVIVANVPLICAD